MSEKKINTSNKLACIDGKWHQLKQMPQGWWEWLPMASLAVDCSKDSERDACVRFDEAASSAMDDLYDLVKVFIPVDFVADAGRDTEAKARESIRRRIICEADKGVVKVSFHIFLEND